MGKKNNEIEQVDDAAVTVDRRKIENLKRYIQKLLSEVGGYTPALSYQVEELARDMMAYRRVSDEFLALERLTVIEKSREGDKRVKAHPLGLEVRQWSDTVRRDLAKLTMNIKDSMKARQVEDEFSKFMEEFNDDDD